MRIVLFVIVLLLAIDLCWSFIPKLKSCLKVKYLANRNKRLFHHGEEKAEPNPANQNIKFMKYECKSCSYVYEEEKGFKKRIPPGKLNNIKLHDTFLVIFLKAQNLIRLKFLCVQFVVLQRINFM